MHMFIFLSDNLFMYLNVEVYVYMNLIMRIISDFDFSFIYSIFLDDSVCRQHGWNPVLGATGHPETTEPVK